MTKYSTFEMAILPNTCEILVSYYVNFNISLQDLLLVHHYTHYITLKEIPQFCRIQLLSNER